MLKIWVLLHFFFFCMRISSFSKYAEDIVLCPHGGIGILVKDNLTVNARPYFCSLYSIPLVYLTVFMPVTIRPGHIEPLVICQLEFRFSYLLLVPLDISAHGICNSQYWPVWLFNFASSGWPCHLSSQIDLRRVNVSVCLALSLLLGWYVNF